MATPRPVHHPAPAPSDGASLRLDVLDGEPTASAAPDPHAPSYDRTSARYTPDDTEDDGGHDGPPGSAGECADVRDELALLLGGTLRRDDQEGPGALDDALERLLDERPPPSAIPVVGWADGPHSIGGSVQGAPSTGAPPASQPSLHRHSIGERRYQARLRRPLTDLELGGRIELFDPDNELED